MITAMNLLLILIVTALVTLGSKALLTWVRHDALDAVTPNRGYDDLGPVAHRHHLVRPGA